jgi:hypothetical protein
LGLAWVQPVQAKPRSSPSKPIPWLPRRRPTALAEKKEKISTPRCRIGRIPLAAHSASVDCSAAAELIEDAMPPAERGAGPQPAVPPAAGGGRPRPATTPSTGGGSPRPATTPAGGGAAPHPTAPPASGGGWPRPAATPAAGRAGPQPATPCHRLRRQEAAGRDTGGWRRSAPRLGRGRCRPSPCAHPRRQEAAGRERPRHPRLEVRRTLLRHRPGEAPPLTPPRHRRQEAAGRAPTQHPPHAGPAGRNSSGGALAGYFGIRFGAMVFVNWWGETRQLKRFRLFSGNSHGFSMN